MHFGSTLVSDHQQIETVLFKSANLGDPFFCDKFKTVWIFNAEAHQTYISFWVQSVILIRSSCVP